LLALVSKLQAVLFTSLPSGLGLARSPSWRAFPLLVTGGLAAALLPPVIVAAVTAHIAVG